MQGLFETLSSPPRSYAKRLRPTGFSVGSSELVSPAKKLRTSSHSALSPGKTPKRKSVAAKKTMEKQAQDFFDIKKKYFEMFEEVELSLDPQNEPNPELLLTPVSVVGYDKFFEELEKPAKLINYTDLLPNEILLKIFSSLELSKDFEAIVITSRRWRDVGLDNKLWKKLYMKQWGSTYSRLQASVKSWRSEYNKKREEILTNARLLKYDPKPPSYGKPTFHRSNSFFLSPPPKPTKWNQKLNR